MKPLLAGNLARHRVGERRERTTKETFDTGVLKFRTLCELGARSFGTAGKQWNMKLYRTRGKPPDATWVEPRISERMNIITEWTFLTSRVRNCFSSRRGFSRSGKRGNVENTRPYVENQCKHVPAGAEVLKLEVEPKNNTTYKFCNLQKRGIYFIWNFDRYTEGSLARSK